MKWYPLNPLLTFPLRLLPDGYVPMKVNTWQTPTIRQLKRTEKLYMPRFPYTLPSARNAEEPMYQEVLPIPPFDIVMNQILIRKIKNPQMPPGSLV